MIAEQKNTDVSLTPLVISLPADQYGHKGAPTEWWWHVGTLQCANGRTFGFEINATAMFKDGYCFTQISITDIEGKKHYQRANPLPFFKEWAQYDTTKPWFVKIPGEDKDGEVTMASIDNNPLNMNVTATFKDADTRKPCSLQLSLFQQGPPLMVWGTGSRLIDKDAPAPISQYNYYYSLTNLKASGTISIDGEEFAVTGLTWMDHEYGAFPSNGTAGGVTWMLQDLQLDNGLHLSNYTNIGDDPKEGVAMPSHATLLYKGKSFFVDTITTPLGPIFTSAKNVKYFSKFLIRIKNSKIIFEVNSLLPNQLFIGEKRDIWEGVGRAEMSFKLKQNMKVPISAGTAWIEQNLS